MNKDRIRLALRTLNGFTQGFTNGDIEDVNITDRFLTANNLTVPAAMTTIGMVKYKDREKKENKKITYFSVIRNAMITSKGIVSI